MERKKDTEENKQIDKGTKGKREKCKGRNEKSKNRGGGKESMERYRIRGGM